MEVIHYGRKISNIWRCHDAWWWLIVIRWWLVIFVIMIWGFPIAWGYPNSWMVYFRETPMLIDDLGVPLWMIGNLHIIYIYIYLSIYHTPKINSKSSTNIISNTIVQQILRMERFFRCQRNLSQWNWSCPAFLMTELVGRWHPWGFQRGWHGGIPRSLGFNTHILRMIWGYNIFWLVVWNIFYFPIYW